MEERSSQKLSKHSKRIAIFDFDGTLVEGHLWGAFLKENFKTKKRVFISFWHLIYHLFLYYLAKFHLYSLEKCLKIWTKDIPQLFQGLRVDEGGKFFQKIWEKYLKPTIKPKVLNRLRWHQRRGDVTILASNAPKDFLRVVKDDLKFDFLIGSRIEIKHKKYTGRSILPIPWRGEKLNQIKELLKRENIKVDFKNSFAYSDSERDIEMLEVVGNPVVVDPDEILFEIAKQKNWRFL